MPPIATPADSRPVVDALAAAAFAERSGRIASFEEAAVLALALRGGAATGTAAEAAVVASGVVAVGGGALRVSDAAVSGWRAAAERVAAVAKRGARAGELEAVALLRAAGRPMRQKEFLAAGIHRQHLADAARIGLLERMARGCYRLPESGGAAPDERWGHLAAAALRWPRAIVCGPTAAAWHGLVGDDGDLVWLAVERGHGRPKGNVGGRGLSIREWLPSRRSRGVAAVVVDNVPVPMVTAAYAVAEMIELSGRLGAALASAAEAAYYDRGGSREELDEALRHIGRVDAAAA
jgi:hypothetical protein